MSEKEETKISDEIIEITKGGLEYGKTTYSTGRVNYWMRMKEDFWGAKRFDEILASMGFFNINPSLIKDLEQLFDSNYNCLSFFYYIAHETDGNTAAKIILGPIAQRLKEKKKGFAKVRDIIDLTWLQNTVVLFDSGKVSMQHMKKFIAKMMDEKINPINLQKHPEFAQEDNTDQIASILRKLKEEFPSQFEKAKTDDKIINWLVGQVMKLTKGKAEATVVKKMVQDAI